MAFHTDKEKMFAIDFESCSRQLYAVAKIHLNNLEDVNDVVQETVLLAYKNYNSLRNKAYFKTWITRILLNEIKKQYKKSQKEKVIAYKEIGFDETNRSDNSLLLRSCISKCDLTTQQIIYLKYYADYTFQEIAHTLRIPLGSVKTKCYRGLKEIKKLIQEDDMHE